ncbi:MAG: hypothetical protein CVV58_06000, partial [Tenericutes bacterium HGW-Tenericutes-3]
MAKNFNRQRKALLERRVSSILYQIELAESYVPVAEKQLTEKMNHKIENFKANQQEELEPIYQATLKNKAYIKLMTDEVFKKLDDKLYWNKRAIHASYQRKYKTKDALEAHQTELNQALSDAE